jgi:hypothetical protein
LNEEQRAFLIWDFSVVLCFRCSLHVWHRRASQTVSCDFNSTRFNAMTLNVSMICERDQNHRHLVVTEAYVSFSNSYHSRCILRSETFSFRIWQIFQRLDTDKNLSSNLWFVFLTWNWCLRDHDKRIEHNSFIYFYHADVSSRSN